VPKPPPPDEVEALLARPSHAVIASSRPDGQPVSVATWYLYEHGRILVNMDEGRRRLAYLREDPRVSLTAMDPDDWYTHVSVQGRMTEIGVDTNLTGIDRISTHYTGKAYPTRDRERVNGWIDIDTWHGWHIKERN